MGKKMNLWFTSQPKVFLLSFPVFCGYKVSWSGMCLIFSVYPQANPGVLGPPSTALCGGTCESSAFCPWTEKQNFPGFLNHQMMGKTCISQDFTGSPLWERWVFAAAPARTDLRTNHCLSAWQDHPLKNSSDKKKPGLLLSNFKSNYLQICLFGNKARLVSNPTFQQKCVLVFALKEFPV